MLNRCNTLKSRSRQDAGGRACRTKEVCIRELFQISDFNPKGVSLMYQWIPSLKLSMSSSLHTVSVRESGGGDGDRHA